MVNTFFPQNALDVVRICKEDQELVFRMVAAILWLGNISFRVTDNENHIDVVDDEGNIHDFDIIPTYGLLTSCVLSKLLYH